MTPYSFSEALLNLSLLAPEMTVGLTALAILILDWFLKPSESRRSGFVALFGLLFAFAMAIRGQGAGDETLSVFRGLLIFDGMAQFFRVFFIGAGLVAVVFSMRSRALAPLRMGEFYVSLLTATMGMSFLAASSNWMMFYIALETVSLPSYVLAGYLRSERRSVEASLKYVLYGGVASAVMLFGISYLYGLSGTLNIAASFAHSGAAPQMHAMALILVMAGLLFKIASVPFQFWAPDVYEGAPTPVTAWLSVASKAAGFAALLRVFSPFMMAKPETAPVLGALPLMWVFWGLSAATMTFGNLAAIKQTNLKRLFAYSSIAHAGYLLMALTVMNQPDMLRTLLFYLAIYFVMNFGAFYCVMMIENRTGRSDIGAIRGILAMDSPSRASAELPVTMILCLLSLTGLPVLAGFIAKFLLFGLLIQKGSAAHVALALVAVANSVVSLYYYFRIARAMTLERPETDIVGQYRLPLFDRAALCVISGALLWLFFSWQTLLRAAEAGTLFLAGL